MLISSQTVKIVGINVRDIAVERYRLPGVSMRFGTNHDGMLIGVQIVGSWQAESTILHVASPLEQVSPVRDLQPNL
jgi:aspartyl-tRNA(Asn)/glutamyl-tRNA(Gln) amidotransferase subunit A